MIEFIKKMLSDSQEVSNKRVLSWVIVLTLISVLIIKKECVTELIDWLGWICITCIGGTAIEGVSTIFNKNKKSE